MRVKRCTRAIIAAFLLLTATAFILDKPGLLAVSLSCWALILYRYLLFFGRIRSVASSVKITRSVDKLLIRQAANCQVTSRITMRVETGVEASYAEIIPAGIHVDDGIIRTRTLPAGLHEETLTYRITPLTHGNIPFPGGLILVEDSFFAIEIPLSRAAFAGPVLHVQPAPFFEHSGTRSLFGGIETHLIRPQHGHSVKSYRKYLQDDDFRTIDWKLSAKYDTLYVREYTSLENYPPLVIIDLPDQDQEYDAEKFSELVQAISSIIENTLKGGTTISLLIISGPNIVSSIFDEHDIAHYLAVIRDRFHPHVRLHHLYRTRPRSEIREELKEFQSPDNNEHDERNLRHRSLLNDIYHHHLLDSGINRFSSQVSRLFSSVRTDEISLFSLCDGDVSYIREIARQAGHSKIRFRIRTPAGRDIIHTKPSCRILRGEIIEGII